MLSLAIGSLPQYSKLSPLPPKPPIINDIETTVWVPYAGDGMSMASS